MSPTTSLLAGRRLRLLTVYRVALILLLSYGFLQLRSVFAGASSRERLQARWRRRAARRVRVTIERVQGLFIKVGQLVSVLTNFVPADFRQELEGLQDCIPARPLGEIEARLQQEFGRGAAELFADFDGKPVASASLAQVHAAHLQDGQRVAVKVQHLDIEQLATLDLRTIRHLLSLLRVVLRLQGVRTAFAELEQMILDELDFEREAANMEAIAATFEDDPQLSCPEVIPARSGRRVLTTTFEDGIKISDRDALLALGIQPQAVADRVLRAYCRMIFVDGLYHADPHPGNLLVRPDGGLVFLDFGAVAQLSPGLKDGIPMFVEGVLKRDRDAILRALQRMGFVPRGDSERTAERVIDYFFTRFLDHVELESWNLQELRIDTKLKLEMMADLNRLDISLWRLTSAFQVPREWVLLQRTLILLLGLVSHLDPELKPAVVIRPYLEEFVLGADRDWVSVATGVVKDMALSILTVPEDLRRLLSQARRGEARVEVGGVRQGFTLLYSLGQQLLFAFLALGTGSLAYLANRQAEESLSRALLAVSGLSLLLLLRALWQGRRWRRELHR